MNKSFLYEYFSLRNSNTYEVKDGDSLYKIANEYGITVDELMNANNLTSTLIYPNQILIIPKQVTNEGVYFEEYKIVQNDTLEKIEKKLGVSLKDISKYNDLTKLQLLGNQVMSIPKATTTYLIKENDTLNSILRDHNLTLDELASLNEKMWIVPGTTIYIK